MTFTVPSIISHDALDHLLTFVRERGLARFCLVADENTFAALGARVGALLRGQGYTVRTIVLQGKEIIADEEQIVQLMLDGGDRGTTYLAVGSGTITDITRFVSHRCGRPFISLPTAPSVDAFASIAAPIVVRHLKQTVSAQAPMAVFADLDTLCKAPRDMVAAGFGDVLAKYVCLADWRLGQLLWDAPYDAEIAAQSRRALTKVAAQATAIGRLEPAAIEALMQGLIVSGISMVRMGNSSPASASEHHLSHFWEMKLLLEGRPAILHGAKVGTGAVLMAREYERIRALSQKDALHLLAQSEYPDAQTQIAEIRAAYGPIADQVIAKHHDYVEMTAEKRRDLQARIREHWDEIQAIAATVPSSTELAELLSQAGGATRPQELGLSDEEVALARHAAHYIRNRFTVRKLELALGQN